MLTSKNAIIFGETKLVISCIEYLLNNNWNIKAVFTNDRYVNNWCTENSIQCLNIDKSFETVGDFSNSYLFSIINPYILPAKLLSKLNPIKAINYHDSLLPNYAGVNSTTWAILGNEQLHGITWHEIVPGIDEGDVVYQTQIPIDKTDTAFSLNLKCTDAALIGFKQLITDIGQNKLVGLKQDLSKKTYFGRDYIPDNYAYLNPTDSVSYINKLLNSLTFGDEYINPIATVKLKLDGAFYILEKKSPQENLNVVDSSGCILKNIYGENVNYHFDNTQIQTCNLGPMDISVCRKLKQKEFAIYNNLSKLLGESQAQSGLLSYIIPDSIREILAIDLRLSVDTLCLFLFVILSRLNADNTFIKIYHPLHSRLDRGPSQFSDQISDIIRNITENISILAIKPHNLELSYRELAKTITDEIKNKQLYIFKDFGYRYKLDLCSDFAITDNYEDEIDNHSVVFSVNQNKITVNFYKKDTDFIKMLVKTISVLLAGHEEAKRTNELAKNIPLLSKEDYQKVIYEWNNTGKEYPQNKTIYQLFEDQVIKTPNNIAVVHEGTKLTYKGLNERANQLAHYLRETYQIQGDDLIALCLNRSEYMIVAILGVLKSGAAYVPIDPVYPKDRIQFILDDTKAKVLITNSRCYSQISWNSFEGCHSRVRARVVGGNLSLHTLVVDDKLFNQTLKKYSISNPESIITSNNLAYVIYTSGTTGTPKGVLQQHNNIHRLLTATDNLFQFNSNDVWVMFHSYVFDFAVWELLGSLCYGSKLVIPTLEQIKDPQLFYQLCSKHRVTVLNQTPQVFYEFTNVGLGCKRLKFLRYIILGGDKLNLVNLKPWFNKYGYDRPKLINMYGITETTVHVTYKEIQEEDIGEISNIGKVIPDQKCYILDTNLNVLPIGSVGELYVGGAGLARGYLNLPKLTDKHFLPNPFQTGSYKQFDTNTRIYKTGDLVRYLPNGDIEYVGRNDSQVKIRGYRIELGEVERVLCTYPSIKYSMALVKELNIPDDGTSVNNKYLVAYYLSDIVLNKEKIITNLSAILPDYMIPQIFIHLDKLPLTINGKLDRSLLPNPQLFLRKNYVPPRNELESKACAIFAEVLGLKYTDIGITNDFFKLGGDSILSIRLVYKLKQIGININVSKVYSYRTINRLISLNANNVVNDGNYTPFSLISEGTKYKIISNSNYVIEDIYPATYLQIGMILEYEKNNYYHIVTCYQFKLQLDMDTICKTFYILMMRHGVLRSSFVEDEEYTFLLIQHKEIDISSKIKLLQGDHGNIINNEKITPIDRHSPGLFRITINSESDGFNLILTTHHAIEDGWSVATLISEFVDLYSDITRTEYYVPSYAKYVAKELSVLSSLKHQDFWKTYLADLEIRNHNLIFDKKSLSMEKLITLEKKLSKTVCRQLLSLAHSLNVTPDIIFLSIYGLTISRFLNTNNLEVGVVVNNRLEETGGDRVFGLHLNTIPMRFKINTSDLLNLKMYILNCQKEKLKIDEYKLYPYGKLKSDLKLSEDIYLFAFSYTNFHIISDKYNKNTVEFNYGYQVTNIPCLLNVSRDIDQFTISIDAKSTFIDTNTIGKFLDYIVYYIDRLLSTNEFDPLIPFDAKKISYWNQTEKKYQQDKMIHQLFEKQAVKTPDNVAVIYKNRKLTYKELNERSNQLAHYLKKAYLIKGDDLIALCLDRSEYILIAILGILKSGGAYVPIDPGYPKDRVWFILNDTAVKVLITNSKCYSHIFSYSDVGESLYLDILKLDNKRVFQTLKKYPVINPESKITSESLAYVIYTSGTTGNPKGVLQQHNNLVQLMDITANFYKFNSKDVWILFHSYAFDFSVWEMWGALIYGGQLVVSSHEEIRNLSAFYKLCSKYGVTVLNQTPSIFYLLSNFILEKKMAKLDALRYVIFGGEALDLLKLKPWLDQYGYYKPKLLNMYGVTETTVHATCKLITVHDIGHNSYIGKGFLDQYFYVLDNNLTPLPIGVIGELYIGGARLARGYLNQPELTAKYFITNPFQQNTRLYKTGDLVRYLPDGSLEYIGRNDSQVKIRGFRIELNEIENILNSFNGIMQSVVVVEERLNNQNTPQIDTKYLIGYYTAASRLNEQEILYYLSSKLPDYMLPNVLIWLEKIPLTINGKLNISVLPKSQTVIHNYYVAPRNIAESKICLIYSEILNLPIEQVGAEHDFFRLGGNSILAINLLYKLQQEVKINLNDIFKLRTPVKIAKLPPFANSLYNKLKQIKLVYDRLSSYKINTEMQKKKTAYLHEVKQINFTERFKGITSVLLTGATGHLGCHILYQLLHETKYKIYLLVRASSDSEALNRINRKFKYYFDIGLDSYQDRIKVMVADIEEQDLGLSKKQYQELITNIDSIIHSAALVKHYGNYSMFYRANVQSTINLLELVKLTKLKDFHYISTLSVFASYHMLGKHYYICTEDDEQISPDNNIDNVYNKSKYEGELTAIKYRQFGVNSNIYRVGNLVMNSKNYRIQKNVEENAFLSRMQTILNIGLIPEEIAKIEISPVDYTALAITKLFNRIELSNQTYHVANPYICKLTNLFELYGNINIRLVTFEEFIDALLLQLNNKINRQYIERFMLHQMWLEEINLENLTKIVVLQNKTDFILNKLGFRWPKITADMIFGVVNQISLRDKKVKKKEPIFEYLESISELIPAPFYWLDINGKCVGLNTLCMEGLGASKKADIVGKSIYEYHTEEVASRILLAVNEVIRTGISLQTEDSNIDMNGKVRYFSSTRAPLHNKKNEVIGVVGTSIEITGQKEAEQLRFEAAVNKAALADKEKLLAEKEKIIVKKEAERLRHENKKLEAENKIKQMLLDKEDAEKEAERLRLANELHELESEKHKIAAEEQEKFKKFVGQVVHDIKSPLASLRAIVNESGSAIPEGKRVTLRYASMRISDIAQHMLSRYKNESDETEVAEPVLVSAAMLEVLSEKRYEHKNVKFEHDFKTNADFVFIQIELGQFKRMISNLLNNAVEALNDVPDGKIGLRLNTNNGWVIINISDNGKGMSQEVINKIKNNVSITEGKQHGSGIGFTQVCETIMRNFGEFDIYSTPGQRTRIILRFPKILPPNWITEEIKIIKGDTIVILDDDDSIHSSWDSNLAPILAKLPQKLEIRHFTQGLEVVKFINSLSAREKNKICLLTDYELLNQNINGLQVIEQTGIKRATLVTSHYANLGIRRLASKLRIKILPKDLAFAVPINLDKKIKRGSKKVDMVCVDDDLGFVHGYVERNFSHLKIDMYSDPNIFLENVEQYPLDTMIVLDKLYFTELSPDADYIGDGIEVAEELSKKGFTRLFLLTSEEPDPAAIPLYLTVILKDDEERIKNIPNL